METGRIKNTQVNMPYLKKKYYTSQLIPVLFYRKPTFVDLGCGNGLLTYLLVKEGYKGYGVDIADRKIWNSLCKDDKDMLRGKWTSIYTFI